MKLTIDTVINSTPVLPGAVVAVTTSGGAAVQLYADSAGTIPVTNPINAVTTNAQGLYAFYVPDGTYTLTFSYADTTPVVVTGFEIFESAPAANPIFSGRLSLNRGLAPTTSSQGANWAPASSTAFVMAADGEMALTGFIQSSLHTVAGTDCLAVSGFAINDAAGKKVWAGYFDVQHEANATLDSQGSEYAIKNKGANVLVTANNRPNGAAYGSTYIGGGDASYGGSPANPSAAALLVDAGASTFNAALVVTQASLATNAGTGAKHVIELGSGHRFNQTLTGNAQGGHIQFGVTTAGKDVGYDQVNEGHIFSGPSGVTGLILSTPALSVNYVSYASALVGASPSIVAAGSDTNIGITVTPKGTGALRVTSGGLDLPVLVAANVASPASGFKRFYTDSVTGRLASRDSAGTVIAY